MVFVNEFLHPELGPSVTLACKCKNPRIYFWISGTYTCKTCSSSITQAQLRIQRERKLPT